MSPSSAKQKIFTMFKQVAFGLFAVIYLTVITTGPALAAPKTYCSTPTQHGCLKPLTVDFTSECVEDYGPSLEDGALVHMNFVNPNKKTAPRAITVYYEGEEFYEDLGFTTPGSSSVTFGPFDNDEWGFVVHWEGQVFGQETFNFTCVQ